MRWYVYFGKGICFNIDDLIYVEEIGKFLVQNRVKNKKKKGGCFLYIKEVDNFYFLVDIVMECIRKNSNEKGKD